MQLSEWEPPPPPDFLQTFWDQPLKQVNVTKLQEILHKVHCERVGVMGTFLTCDRRNNEKKNNHLPDAPSLVWRERISGCVQIKSNQIYFIVPLGNLSWAKVLQQLQNRTSYNKPCCFNFGRLSAEHTNWTLYILSVFELTTRHHSVKVSPCRLLC